MEEENVEQTTLAPHLSTGSVSAILFDIESPIEFKQLELNPRALTLMTGLNGTGKTFININIWAMTMVAQYKIRFDQIFGPNSPSGALVEAAQFVYDHSFIDQNINGTIKVRFDSGAAIRVVFDKGKINYVGTENFSPTMIATNAIYMSREMRTFSSISTYLSMRKMIAPSKTHEEIVQVLCDSFRLFDVMYIEGLIAKCTNPIPISPDMQTRLLDMGLKLDIQFFGVDLNKCDFFVSTPDGTKWCSILSAGEQSILNMMMAAA